MTDIRFQSFEDGELADIWYALADASARYPGHFFGLANAILEELQERRGRGLHPWLDARYQPFRPTETEPNLA
jgi:hypothetical protein